MRDGLKRDLVRYGLKASHFHYEEFEMRSGIGIGRRLRSIFGWVTSLLQPRFNGSQTPQTLPSPQPSFDVRRSVDIPSH